MREIRKLDKEKRIIIWDKPVGYSEKSKLPYMNIDFEGNKYDLAMEYSRAINGQTYKDISRIADSFTYLHSIKGGYEEDTFTDKPYIVPYPVKGSKYAVIILAGGGFAYKTIDGSVSGGKAIASKLVERGISAFLLHYRSNPYRFPLAMLDLQRAIRYLRFHREDYGFDNDKLYAMGFSAGAYVVGSFIYKYMGEDTFPEYYEKDQIDREDDSINKAAHIYPLLTFNYHLPMLNAVLDKSEFDSEAKMKATLEELDLKRHVNNTHVMQFTAYSNKDLTIPQESVEDYYRTAREKGVNFSRVFVPEEDHGFSDDLYIDELVKWIEF